MFSTDEETLWSPFPSSSDGGGDGGDDIVTWHFRYPGYPKTVWIVSQNATTNALNVYTNGVNFDAIAEDKYRVSMPLAGNNATFRRDELCGLIVNRETYINSFVNVRDLIHAINTNASLSVLAIADRTIVKTGCMLELLRTLAEDEASKQIVEDRNTPYGPFMCGGTFVYGGNCEDYDALRVHNAFRAGYYFFESKRPITLLWSVQDLYTYRNDLIDTFNDHQTDPIASCLDEVIAVFYPEKIGDPPKSNNDMKELATLFPLAWHTAWSRAANPSTFTFREFLSGTTNADRLTPYLALLQLLYK